ncbi:tetratricopeptide repeat protein [Lacinutrix sp. MEBiC02595]
MSLSENLQNQADDYLKDTLSIPAKKAFELLLQENEELADYISINKEMQAHYNEEDWSFVDPDEETVELESYLKSNEAKALQASVKKVNDSFVKERPFNKKNYFSYLAIAASIIVFVGYFVFSDSPTNLEVYSDYNDWSNLPSLTSRGDSDNILLVNGEKAFLNKEYQEAVVYFEDFLTTTNTNATALLYYGISNIELGNYEKALDAFNQLISSETLDSSKGYWYKMLTYLKMEDKANSIKQLELIVQDSGNYKFEEAQELLEKLRD